MIQLNLYKAKMMTADIETVIHCELDDARAKVEKVNILSNKMNEILTNYLDHGISISYHHELIKLNSEIIALTQGL